MAEARAHLDLTIPIPTTGRPMPTKVADAQERLAKITKETPRDRKGEEAFLATKVNLARTHPRLDRADRALALEELTERIGKAPLAALAKKKTPPVPGGVGYGFFYNTAFKTAFYGGTSFYFEVVCPRPPGGNVNTWLYLTGMNRASRGIEAFVSYYAQQEPHFKVFDWARSDHWQLSVRRSRKLPRYRLRARRPVPRPRRLEQHVPDLGCKLAERSVALEPVCEPVGLDLSIRLPGDAGRRDDRLDRIVGTHRRDVPELLQRHVADGGAPDDADQPGEQRRLGLVAASECREQLRPNRQRGVLCRVRRRELRTSRG